MALAASLTDVAGTARDEAPGNTTAQQEADVTETLRVLLGLDAGIPATTPFVDAGLTSLDLMEFVLEVNQRLGVNLSVQDCFSHRDIASLARVIERARGAVVPAGPPPARVPAPVPTPPRTPAAIRCPRGSRRTGPCA